MMPETQPAGTTAGQVLPGSTDQVLSPAPASPGRDVLVHFFVTQEKVGQLTGDQFANLQTALTDAGISPIQPHGGLTIKFRNQANSNDIVCYDLLAVYPELVAAVKGITQMIFAAL